MTLRRIATVVLGMLVLTACGAGQTLVATDVTDASATLTGKVHNTATGPTDYWFEYGTTTQYGTATPTGTVDVVAASGGTPVEADVDDLEPETTYHYRLCAQDDEGGFCGLDRTFTTTGPRDTVTGTGILLSIPEFGIFFAAQVGASSASDGSDVDGVAVVAPGSFIPRVSDWGPVTCLAVAGNRAAIGFMAQPPDIGEPLDPVPRVVFVEDNGPTGDRLSWASIAAPATTCPTPTDTDFVPVGGLPIGPGLESGDFTVVDAD